MKPIIFFAAALWASLAPLYAKAQCAVQPSCSSLGYTYTGSTSDCVNTPMKCPFNTSYFNCTKKADVFYMFKINWNSATTLRAKTYFTVPKPGIIIGHGLDIYKYGMFLTINSRKFGAITGVQSQKSFIYANVYTGDRVYVDADDVHVVFLPYYGG